MQQEEPVNQKEVLLKGTIITVDEEVYTKQITPPDPTKVLQIPLAELNRIVGTHVKAGPTLEYKENSFTTYSIDATTYQEVQTAYTKIRLDHAEARHIVCAWNVPQDKFHLANDGCDDEEYGASLPLAKLLAENQITHRAIFIVRKCGLKLQQDRIPCYTQLAHALIQKHTI